MRTFTFLFTDIEGSTILWEHNPEAMREALQRHDVLLRDAIETNEGRVFKTVGDAFCAAFESPADAVQAAIAAQRALVAEPWPPAITAIRSRMGLHTGPAEERDRDFFGPPLNRVARLESAAHGGQMVLSLATQQLVGECLPAGVTLVELGTFRLKNLLNPERIYQVNADGLPHDFPALRTLDTQLSNLPSERTPFVGRAREVAALLSILRRPDVRLVTLTGPGGTGKTRLCIHIASTLLAEFPDGVWFVELETITDSAGLVAAIASTLGVKSGPSGLLPSIQEFLLDRRLLLVLDNFEQLVSSAPVVGELLKTAGGVKVITSSRERLRLYGEHDYPVPPLALPELGRRQTAAIVGEYEAVRLFAQRAQAAQPGFEVTEENAAAIAEICVRLDGLPLAIELAAARSRMLAPQAMLERLQQRLQALTGGARDLPARQRTIRGAIGWSYELLNDEERRLFRCLAVFSGGWTLEAAEAVLPVGFDAFAGLESLVDKSLVRDGAGDAPRFGMLETIRWYAIEQLGGSSESDDVHRRHAEYFMDFAERYGYSMDEERDFTELYPLVVLELDNFRAALTWSCSANERSIALRLLAPLWQVWNWSANQSEGDAWLARALRLPGTAAPLVEANAYRIAANLSLSVSSNDVETTKRCRRYYIHALRLYHRANCRNGVLACIQNMAITYRNVGDSEAAIRFLTHAYESAERTGRSVTMRLTLMNLAAVYAETGENERAIAHAYRAVEVARSAANLTSVSHALYFAGTTLLQTGRHDESLVAAQEALESLLVSRTGVFMAAPVAHCIFLLARLVALSGGNERAAQLLGIMERLVPVAEMGFDREHADSYDDLCKRLEDALGASAFNAARTAGLQMSTEDALEFARKETLTS